MLANSLLAATRIESDDTASHGPRRALIWVPRTSTDGLVLAMNRHRRAGTQDSTGRPCPRSRPPGGAGRRPEVSGWHRLATAVCGEYVRKLLRARRLRWSQPCNQWTVNPSRKLRRFESFTCHHVHKWPLTSGDVGQGPFCCVRPCPARSGDLRVSVAYLWPGRGAHPSAVSICRSAVVS